MIVRCITYPIKKTFIATGKVLDNFPCFVRKRTRNADDDVELSVRETVDDSEAPGEAFDNAVEIAKENFRKSLRKTFGEDYLIKYIILFVELGETK